MPRNAGAWLTTVAKRKAVDHWRRQENLDAKYAVMARDLETHIDEAWDPDRIDDDGALLLSREIARDIERELEYPGQIKVTVIRESRAVEYAK